MVVHITTAAPWDVWSDQTFAEFLDKVCAIKELLSTELLIIRLDFTMPISEKINFAIVLSPNTDRSSLPKILTTIRNMVKFLREHANIVFVPFYEQNIYNIDGKCSVILELIGDICVIFTHNGTDVGKVKTANDKAIVLDTGVIISSDGLRQMVSKLVDELTNHSGRK